MNSPELETPQAQSPPPLRIHHFMLWSAVSAVMLTVLKSADEGEVGFSFMQGANVPYLLTLSLAVCGLGMGLYWKCRGIQFFNQPGHTAFISYGMSALFVFFYSIAWKLYSFPTLGRRFSGFDYLLVYGWYAQLLLQVVLSFLFAYQFRATRRWKYFFLVQALMTMFQIACYLVVNNLISSYMSIASDDDFYWSYLLQTSIPLLIETITSLCLAIVVWKDCRQGVNYHWTHWLGVAIWFAMWVAMIAALVWTLVSPPEWLTDQARWSAYPPE